MNNNSPTLKDLTDIELYRLGIPKNNFSHYDELEDLKKNPPNIVIADCILDMKFVQNKFKEQNLKKKHKYVMSSGIYMQLYYDPRIKGNGRILKPSKVRFKDVYKKYEGQDLSGKSLLIFRQGGIGDLLFIQPNLRFLKEKYPTCKIKFACSPQYQPMVKEWDCIDKLIDLPFSASELFNTDYHCVFEGVIERCKEAERIGAYNLFTKWLGLNLPDELLIPKQKTNELCDKRNDEILTELGINEKDFIVLQMKASSPVRSPSPKLWKKLIDILTEKGHNILITDSPHYAADIDIFISKLNNPDKVKNYCKFSRTIADTISIISKSKLTIATDSSTPHIAESLGIKSFSIMGPFPGEVRYNTYKNNDYINAVREGCSPCFLHGSKPCKNSIGIFSACYENLDMDLCIEKIERLLDR